MSEEKKYSRYRIDQLAKELGGTWYHKVVTNGRTESKQIVIEYDHKKCQNLHQQPYLVQCQQTSVL